MVILLPSSEGKINVINFCFLVSYRNKSTPALFTTKSPKSERCSKPSRNIINVAFGLFKSHSNVMYTDRLILGFHVT